jgi:hypothetical protein
LPYRVALVQELQQRFENLRVFVNSLTEPEQTASDSSLPICQQKTWTINTKWRHPHRFTDDVAIRIPYDTWLQLRAFRPDVIVSGEMGARTLLAAAYKRAEPRTRLVIWATLSEATEQGRGILRPILRRILLRTADAVMVNGESGARYIRRFGVPPASIIRVPQATELSGYLSGDTRRPAATRRRLLYSGRLIELKGLLPFFATLGKWAIAHPQRSVEFWIAGDGPLREQIQQVSVPSNVGIRMLGHVPYDRLPEIYRQCGVLAFPTLADEWGMVVVESMAAGLPVLGSIHSQAVEELVQNEVNGWTFRPEEPADASRALGEVFAASDEILDEMGARARNTVRDLTPITMADRMEAAIDYAITQGS